MKLLVKWDCGCIGFNPEVTGDEFPIVIKPCEGLDPWRDHVVRDGSLCLFGRKMHDKTFEVLPVSEQKELLEAVRGLMGDGQRFRMVKQLLLEEPKRAMVDVPQL